MKIQTWNIRHGGKKSELQNIMQSLTRHNADVIILTEFRENDNAIKIREELNDLGWIYQFSSKPPENQNGILILSKMFFENKLVDYQLPQATHRWTDIYFPNQDISILGIHIPGYKDKWGKKDFWENLISFAKEKTNKKYILIGDFNTGLGIDAEGAAFKLSEYMHELINLGWIDVWRYFYPKTKDYTWHSNTNNGFRIDYAFISLLLEQFIFNAYHSHNERIKGFSDHSALVIELDQ